MAWSFFAAEIPYLIEGAEVTVLLCLLAIVFGTILGLISSLFRQSKTWMVYQLGNVYSWLFRSLPAIMTLFYVYYALPQIGIRLDSFVAAVLGLSLVSGAYFSEVIMGGFAGINYGQYAAAKSLGMSQFHTMKRIILPQVARIILPSYISQCTYVVKSTSLAALIAVNELTGNAYGRISDSFRPLEILLIAGVIYLILNSVLVFIQLILERRFAVARK